MTRRWLRAAIIAIAALSASAALLPAASAADGVVCRFTDKRFTEISGMAPSVRHANVLWMHNDSGGGPKLFAVDSRTCKTLATITVRGAKARDWEAIASGRDNRGRPVLWIGDIGDNRDNWPYVEVLKVKEPRMLRDRSVKAATYRFTYDDMPHNAETLLADPARARLWVVTKQLAHGGLYALPDPLAKGRVNVAKRLRTEGGLITDGAMSPTGDRYVLRDYADAVIYRGLPPGREVARIALPYQFQGEAISWSPDGNSLLIASERDDRLIRVPVPISAR